MHVHVHTGGGKQGTREMADWFDACNEAGWQQLLEARHGCDVISLAHFLPYQVRLVSSWRCTVHDVHHTIDIRACPVADWHTVLLLLQE